jgi:tetratricopeptide (TPR) repeat protein
LAANKDKLLESAQKSLKKKQVSKAIKDYAKIVEIDPADVRSRQKLAELYVRTNKNTEAYEQYESVAKYFSSNGFHLKAIAIYKQMQRLDPSQISIFNRLAELNEKQGLLGNAMAEYRNLVSYFERNGMIADVIKTLEKMRELDPDNLNIRIKLAEVYANNERQDEGLEELESALEVLSEKGAYDKILKLYKMFLPLYPNNKKMQMGLALAFYEKGDYVRGVTILESLLRDKLGDPDLLRLVGRGYTDVKNWAKARNTYLKLLDMDPTDLDVRESLIHCEISSKKYENALSELEEWKDTFFKADRLDRLKEFYEVLKEKLNDNSIVIETLDSIYELTGEGDKLLDILSEKEEDTEERVIEETLSDSLLGSAEADITDTVFDLDLTDSDDLLEFDVVEEDSVDLQLESIDDSFSVDEVNTDAFIELEIDEDLGLEQEESSELDLSFDLPEEEPTVEDKPPQRNMTADLEEAEFYLQQGLYAESEKLCRDILAYAPDSHEAHQKLEEIATMQSQADVAIEPSADVTHKVDSLTDSFSVDDFDFDIDGLNTETEIEKKVFKTDVDEQIAADDMESHYNLGIAYREMGLYDDAISEFEKAEREPSRFVDCQTLKGLCFSDKNDYSNAERMFQQALDSQYLEDIQRLNLGYELGLLYERADRLNDALISYRNVFSLDNNYRDVGDKISMLTDALGIVDETLDSPELETKERISFL